MGNRCWLIWYALATLPDLPPESFFIRTLMFLCGSDMFLLANYMLLFGNDMFVAKFGFCLEVACFHLEVTWFAEAVLHLS